MYPRATEVRELHELYMSPFHFATCPPALDRGLDCIKGRGVTERKGFVQRESSGSG